MNKHTKKPSPFEAGKVLAKQAEKIRKIQPPPKVGSISLAAARNAAKTVLGRKK